MWRCLRDPTFSRFSKTPTCDRRTDGHTNENRLRGRAKTHWRVSRERTERTFDNWSAFGDVIGDSIYGRIFCNSAARGFGATLNKTTFDTPTVLKIAHNKRSYSCNAHSNKPNAVFTYSSALAVRWMRMILRWKRRRPVYLFTVGLLEEQRK